MEAKNYELIPQGLLFFRDGRPMDVDKSESANVRNIGHGAVWPRPDLLFKGAMHAMLNDREANERQHFGQFQELKVMGPYPIRRSMRDGKEVTTMYLPCPQDWGMNIEPMAAGESDLPQPLTTGFIDSIEGKKSYPKWITLDDYLEYLDGKDKSKYIEKAGTEDAEVKFPYRDSELFSTEKRMGTTMDPATGASLRIKDQFASGRYQGDYLRLNDCTSMWCAIETGMRKQDGNVEPAGEVPEKFILGGQGGMVVRADTNLDPIQKLRDWTQTQKPKAAGDGSIYVRWTLLAPALWLTTGWLPSFCRDSRKDVPVAERKADGQVMLPDCEGAELVGACVDKAIWFSGWDTLTHVKPTVMAVPAGSAYLFRCQDAKSAEALVAALNLRRRSDLGEQGFGIGVCSYVNVSVQDNK